MLTEEQHIILVRRHKRTLRGDRPVTAEARIITTWSKIGRITRFSFSALCSRLFVHDFPH